MSDRIGGLGDIGESVQNALLERAGRVAGRVQERRGLTADLLESDDEYLVVFDAPGTVSTDVQVRYVEGSVKVRVDRFRDYHEGFDMRFPGRGLALEGEVTLPGDAVVEPDAATATLTDHGTLEVRLPKDPDADPIDVEDDQDEPIGVDLGERETEQDQSETDGEGESDERATGATEEDESDEHDETDSGEDGEDADDAS